MPSSVRIEYYVIPSEGASLYSTLGEPKNVMSSLAICEALGIEASQTATVKALDRIAFQITNSDDLEDVGPRASIQALSICWCNYFIASAHKTSSAPLLNT
jgi:hypothetical protein